jgi:predicted metal-binding membrane protein
LIEMGAMPMAGQLRPAAAAAAVCIWIAMMVAMMLPSLAPTLWRYRLAFERSGGKRPASLTALVGAGYLFVWSAFGIAALPLGNMMAALTRAVPIAAGVIVLIAGAMQFTAWKAHHLACCRREARHGCSLPRSAGTALRSGVRLGLHCSYCCAGFTATLLVAGDMGLRAMTIATVAITAERLAPHGEHVARTIGMVAVCAGVLLIARAV